MRIDEIRDLVQLLEASDLSEIEITRLWGKIRISKHPQGAVTAATGNGNVPLASAAGGVLPAVGPGAMPPAGAVVPGMLDATAVAAAAAAAEATATATAEKARYKSITSPMVGTFYRAPAPDADPYTQVGQRIEVGQTVCIIEAMKLMNEIESDLGGRVVEVLVENAQPVEYGQTLLLIDPA